MKGLHIHRPNRDRDPLRLDQALLGELTRDSGGLAVAEHVAAGNVAMAKIRFDIVGCFGVLPV
jgi:hypothetical protein